MGNYKQVYFEGVFLPDMLQSDVPSEEHMVRCVHATICTMKVDRHGTKQEVIGALLTTSTINPAEHIASYLQEGEIVIRDSDWTDVRVYEVENGRIIFVSTYRLSKVEKVEPQREQFFPPQQGEPT